MHYANPSLDRLIDRLYVTLDTSDQAMILQDIGDIFAAEVPVLPMLVVMEFAVVRKGVRAMVDDFVGTVGPGNGPGLIARNAYRWDRD